MMKTLSIGDLTVSIPIVQGGMGVGVSLSGLASAVANEGGVGVISSAGLGLLHRNLSKDYQVANLLGLSREIELARENTGGILGVNIMVAMSNFTELVKTAIREKIDIIFSGAGLPFDLPSFRTKGSATKLVPIISSGRAAKIISEKWLKNYKVLPDALVVEGPKAGGHLGFKTGEISDQNYRLDKLVADVREVIRPLEHETGNRIPVIAAGGIYTGKDIYDIIASGADAVQMGTRFVTTDECDASMEFKQTYIDAAEKDIEIINSPVGMPGRAIVNAFIEKIRQGKKQPLNCPFQCIRTCDVSSSPYCIISALFNAFRGNFDSGFAFAGTNAFRATRIQSIREVFADLKEEFNQAMNFYLDLPVPVTLRLPLYT